jgi:hypothetical protein
MDIEQSKNNYQIQLSVLLQAHLKATHAETQTKAFKRACK